MTSAGRSRISAYAIAVGLTILALVLTLLLGYFIQRAVFILFFPAVILSAWVGGLGPGLVATALSALAAAFSSMQSPALFTAGSWDDLFLIGLFVLVAGLISSLQAARQRAEEWFQVTLTSIGDAVIVTDLEGRVVLMNPEAERLTGWSQAEARQRDLVEVFRIVNEYTRQAVDNPVTAVLRQGTKVGLANHTILLGKPVRMSGVCMDITERKCAEAELQAAFREKEVLLKEVDHRVKNNLQIISSLLSLQADGTQDPYLVEKLQDSQHRVHAMALIHEQLYQAADFSKITFADYIQRLAEQVVNSHHPHAERVTLRLQLADIALAIDQAIPCGGSLELDRTHGTAFELTFPLEIAHAEDMVQP